jgi:hypothetical protein
MQTACQHQYIVDDERSVPGPSTSGAACRPRQRFGAANGGGSQAWQERFGGGWGRGSVVGGAELRTRRRGGASVAGAAPEGEPGSSNEEGLF